MRDGIARLITLAAGCGGVAVSGASWAASFCAPTRSRAEARQACAIAARGATAAAVRYRAMRNPASARFYDGWATTLRRCEGGGE